MKIKIPSRFIKVREDCSEIYKVKKDVIFFDSVNLRFSLVKNKISGKNNKIYIKDGDILREVKKVPGLTFKISGNDNKIIIDKSCYFMNSSIYIWGSQGEIIFAENVRCLKSLIDQGTNSTNRKIYIGKNNYLLEMKIHNWGDNVNFILGDFCMLSSGIKVLTSDGHPIKNIYTEEIINKPGSVNIGEKCWIGKDVTFCKNITIVPNTIVGIGSVVTKSFHDENTIIAGNPARVIKKDVTYSFR